MSGASLGFLALAIFLGTGAFWYQRMQAVRTAGARPAVVALMAVSACLGFTALLQGAGLAGGIAAGFALVAGGTFVALQLQAGQSTTAPNVRVGGPILDFTAPDDAGASFDLATLRGKPFLLKFFRGHW